MAPANNYYSRIAKKYLKRMSIICNENNLNFIVCLSPTLSLSKENEKYLELLCKDYDIAFWNMTHYINNSKMFHDSSHLNDKGATIFTDEIIRKLREIKK